MKKAMLAAACAVMAILLAGCTAKDIEEQAYAVSLGVDLMEDGQISVSVQVPALNQSGSSESGGDSGGSGGGGKGYSFAAASGGTLTDALKMLHATLPRALNLTGVKSVIISQKLAEDEKFEKVLHEMALSYRVYGAAELIVCRGEAQEFIKNQQAVIGLRLSESTTVALSHYHEIGCIPSGKAADVYYMIRSVYSDPVAALAAVNEDREEGGGDYAGDLARSGDNKNLYYGSALFRKGRMVGVLDGEQTQLLNVLLGNLKEFSRVIGGVPVRIGVSGGPKVTIRREGEYPAIEVRLEMTMMDAEYRADTRMAEEEIRTGLEQLTAYCQSLGTDPFGYADRAAGQFLTIEDWLRYDWREKFRKATVRYDVNVRRAEY